LTILEARTIEFGYDPRSSAILRGSVTIEAGSFVAVIGSNGCGKSTLIRVLAGLLRPWKGSVLYSGRGIHAQDRREVARALAYVPQNTSRAFPFTSLEVVLTGRSPHNSPFRLEGAADLKMAMEALETVGVQHLARRRITELSGGERQLVSVARALAQEPECLLLDEPSSSLDLKHRSALIRMLLDQRRRKGLTVVMITHDLTLVEPAFDFVLALRCGSVAASGSPAQVMTESVLADIYDDPFIRVHRIKGQLCVWSEVHA
jgi:iron complex transport system ATP-binding protein